MDTGGSITTTRHMAGRAAERTAVSGHINSLHQLGFVEAANRSCERTTCKPTPPQPLLTAALALVKRGVADGHASGASSAPLLGNVPHTDGHQGSGHQAANHAACSRGWGGRMGMGWVAQEMGGAVTYNSTASCRLDCAASNSERLSF